MKVERWCVVSRMDYGFQPPDVPGKCLQGLVMGHRLYADGKAITTSRVVHRKGDLVLTRSGSEYELGEPDPRYEAQYPNAKERLLESLEQCAENTDLSTHGFAHTFPMANDI